MKSLKPEDLTVKPGESLGHALGRLDSYLAPKPKDLKGIKENQLTKKLVDEGVEKAKKGEVLTKADMDKAMKQEVQKVIIKDSLIEYALKIVDDTRSLSELEYGLSPRAGLVLLSAARANAYIKGRDFVIPEDIIEMADATLPHRLVLTSKAYMERYTGEQLITKVIDKIKLPE